MFYLILPLVAVLAVGRSWRPVRTIVIVSGSALLTAGWLTMMGLGWLDAALHTMWFPSYAAWFGTGMALAAAHVALRTGTAPAAFRVLDDLASAPGHLLGRRRRPDGDHDDARRRPPRPDRADGRRVRRQAAPCTS